MNEIIKNLKRILSISQDAFVAAFSYQLIENNGLTTKTIYDAFLHNTGLIIDWMKLKYGDSEATDRMLVPYVIAKHISFEVGQKIEDVEKYIDFVWETYDKWHVHYTEIAQKHNPSLDVNAEAGAKTLIEIIDILKGSNEG